MAPPSPSPDYPPRPAPRHISKSIASLAGPPEPRPPARREEQPGPAIPAPDYEGDQQRPGGRDVWGGAVRYRGASQPAQPGPTETLKQAVRSRPPVKEVIREITKVGSNACKNKQD